MIFAGDVAIAHADCFYFPHFPTTLLHRPWYLNLYGDKYILWKSVD